MEMILDNGLLTYYLSVIISKREKHKTYVLLYTLAFTQIQSLPSFVISQNVSCDMNYTYLHTYAYIGHPPITIIFYTTMIHKVVKEC